MRNFPRSTQLAFHVYSPTCHRARTILRSPKLLSRTEAATSENENDQARPSTHKNRRTIPAGTEKCNARPTWEGYFTNQNRIKEAWVFFSRNLIWDHFLFHFFHRARSSLTSNRARAFPIENKLLLLLLELHIPFCAKLANFKLNLSLLLRLQRCK